MFNGLNNNSTIFWTIESGVSSGLVSNNYYNGINNGGSGGFGLA